ncbi:Hypothetical predicted protein [Pelobates cultripes]|uniref:Uncharacterized protein n=1 Tax=Pelobates cultripes TaxID=61616 RepID=A0AAD1SXQ3_PELCU|nr:Hypothetical predicted protein [Pelobates cultripes]
MEDATCRNDCRFEWHHTLTKLDAIFNAFWAHLANKERHTKAPVHSPDEKTAYLHHRRTGLHPKGPKRWRRKRRLPLLAHKQARSRHAVKPTQSGLQAPPRPGMKQRPAKQTRDKPASKLRTHSTTQRAPEYQRETLLTHFIGTGLCSDRRARRPLELTTLRLAVPRQDSQIYQTPFYALGIG